MKSLVSSDVSNEGIHEVRKLFELNHYVVISEDTDRTVRSYLARTGGGKGGLSRFVDRAVRQAIFWETVETIQERNRHLSAEEAQALADEAVAQARADRS